MSNNRCERCNRIISDPNARYGWRCAEILGVSKELNYAGDEVFRAFILGVQAANEYSQRNNLGKSEKQVVYGAMVKRFLSADMHNPDLWRSANKESVDAILDKSCKSLAEYMDLRDEFDYGNGSYSTTRYLGDVPSDKIKRLQCALNKIGVRDRFGNRLIEDGLYGPKTQWANDVLIKGNASAAKNGIFLSFPDNWEIKKTSYNNRANNPCVLVDLDTKTRLFQIDSLYSSSNSNSPLKYHINVESYADAPAHQQTIAAKLNHKEISKGTYNILKDFNKLDDVVKKGGKALAVVGYAFDAYELSTAVYSDLNDEDRKLGKTTVNSAAGVGGSWAGGAAGAKLGSIGGAAIGTFVLPGLGTAIGGFVGGAIGGMVGSYAGRELGEHLVDETYKITEGYNERQKAY